MRWPWQHPAPPPDPAEIEEKLADLERRADRVEESLRDRMARNNFAAGIASAWGRREGHA